MMSAPTPLMVPDVQKLIKTRGVCRGGNISVSGGKNMGGGEEDVAKEALGA